GNFWLVAVIDDNQLEMFAFGRTDEPHVHFAREGTVLALRGVSDAIPFAGANLGGQTVPAIVEFFHEAAVMERVEQAEAHAVAQARALHHVAKAQNFSGRLKRLQDFRRVDERLDDVRPGAIDHFRRLSAVAPTITRLKRQKRWRQAMNQPKVLLNEAITA